jgi:dipeptidyl aminopeptidase/acylaminoacyl peptidase
VRKSDQIRNARRLAQAHARFGAWGLVLGLALSAWIAAPAAAAPSPRMLVETVDLSSPAISPDGRWVAFRQEQASVDRNAYATAWYVQALDGGAPPVRVADAGDALRGLFGETLFEPPSWSPDGRWIYYRALVDGAVQVWRAARDGSHAEAVTHDDADVVSFALGADGRDLLYTVGPSREATARAEQAEADRGVRIDRTVPLGEGVFRAAYVNGRLADERYIGNWVELGGLLEAEPKLDWVVDLVSGARRAATEQDRRAFVDALPVTMLKAAGGSDPRSDLRTRSSRDGAIAFLRRTGAGAALLVARRPELDVTIVCPDPVCAKASILALAWRPGRDEVVFTVRDRTSGSQILYDWDVSGGTVRGIAGDAGLFGGGRDLNPGESCALSADRAACVVASADTPPHLERIDLQDGTRLVLYQPNLALIAARGQRTQPLIWTAADGQVFTGVFFPPESAPGAGPAPLFISYYSCGGYLRGGLGDEWPLASFAGAGIAALCIQMPASDGSKPGAAVANYRTALSGVTSAIDLLSRRGLVDPARVGMGGLSFGSEVVMWVMDHSNLLAAASVATPVMTPTYYRLHQLMGPNFTDTLRRNWGLGGPGETPAVWKMLSPAFNLDRLQAPLLMQMPEQEYLNGLDYIAPLAGSSTPSELYVFPNEPHLKFQPRHLLAIGDRNLDWFRFWLQGYVDPDPAKADQYQRWGVMRARAAAAGQHPGRPGLEAHAAARQGLP